MSRLSVLQTLGSILPLRDNGLESKGVFDVGSHHEALIKGLD
jgi:hypothetical protein